VSSFVFDAFAMLALVRDEPGAQRVQEILDQGQARQARLIMSAINLGEVFYKTVRESGLDRAKAVLAMVKQFPVEILPVDQNLALVAAEIKGVHRISYADCIAAALAQRLGATLVTGDEGLRQLADLQIEWLPK
jgi:predicted nucleic acid-binding protein